MTGYYPKPTQICSIDRLRDTWSRNYKKNFKNTVGGVDGVTAIEFHKNLQTNVEYLNFRIRNNQYVHKPLRPIVFDKDDGGKRIICVPTVEDRLVQRRIAEFLSDGDKLGVVNQSSFGFRKNAGVKDAVNRAKNLRDERNWALKADISSFFDTIPREDVKSRVRKKLQRHSVVPILFQIIETEEKGFSRKQEKEIRAAGLEQGKGLRQGMPLSPMLSNLFLSHFDKWCERNGIKLVRYADDFVIFANSEKEINEIHDQVKDKLKELGLDLSGKKTFVCDPAQAVSFLGYNVARSGTSKQYKLHIPEHAFEKTRLRLREFTDIDYLLKEYGSLSKSVKVLDAVYKSYLSAYDGAHNLKDYKSLLEDNRQQVMKIILTQIFGKKSVSRLSDEMLEFICG